ncbi:MAG: DNA-directed RNA polymerase subunit beta' [SAR202 cluster bacterium]|jgi:DNA-directed RNA polymerase subunit beta'|nr:MAG: DNA-directed RNA polymerase subunit beta' [SAR202 cluster bacterium]
MTQSGADFNAIRISLASPEQIRAWSYGEVTKPETINYRTLRPEKDGLFCERIFGPTKDWECYCGKYKKIRYKGVICDRCGVEVARSKVRRERMGHVKLAAPVAHIWFSKGTPSRLGLILDLSPRNLERILYFSQYVVTSVDDMARQNAIEQLEAYRDAEITRFDEDLKDAVSEKNVEPVLASTMQAMFDAKLEADRIATELAELDKPKKKLTKAQTAKAEKEALELAESQSLEIESYKGEGALTKLTDLTEEQKEAVKVDVQNKIDDLEAIRVMDLLTEARFRELRDKFGHVFRASMGAESVLEILENTDLDSVRIELLDQVRNTSGQRRKKAIKRLRVVEAFRKSGNKSEWMILTVLPVLPPELHPMVQLDGGRFATSDLNDLYRRVINRNNRLKHLIELQAPDIIIRNEKRMLQEAVDALIDNGRRGRAIQGSHNHKLKSLTDLLRGKQGRFRQNLLGKRVDYSGRSVIISGPQLNMYECGLPKKMALELFKPFVMNALVVKGYAHNIKSAKRMTERARPEIWDLLEEVIQDHPVMLNRAPTLHRLGIQAFQPVLVDGSAIQIHPLVCTAFNADFDGDQMAVHVPLSREAVIEAQRLMLSTNNMLAPSSGFPIVSPTLDMVLGVYYLTGVDGDELTPVERDEEGNAVFDTTYADFDDVRLAFDTERIKLRQLIKVRDDHGELIETTVGRVIFNWALPKTMEFRNHLFDRGAIEALVGEVVTGYGNQATSEMLDQLKNLGFKYATQSGTTIAMKDIVTPPQKQSLLSAADTKISKLDEQYQEGLITDHERYEASVGIWTDVSNKMTDAVEDTLDKYGGIFTMAASGAKGNIAQIKQMAGMRGLMSDPKGRIIEMPIRSSFSEGLSVLEYFISTHGARKGLADTALRTADSGYLTRRLADVAQDVIITTENDPGAQGILITDDQQGGQQAPLAERIVTRYLAEPIVHPETGELIADRDDLVTRELAERIMDAKVKEAWVFSPLSSTIQRGISQKCYGGSLATGDPALLGEAVGIIAAQSIGEPGTQLTMRTFHTGGVAGKDITSGLPRVVELFEARQPKGMAVLSEIGGQIEIGQLPEGRVVRVTSTEVYSEEMDIPQTHRQTVKTGDWVDAGEVVLSVKKVAMAAAKKAGTVDELQEEIFAPVAGTVQVTKTAVRIAWNETDEREYVIPAASEILVSDGDKIDPGTALTDGPKNPQDILRIEGQAAVQRYLVDEVQAVYRSQGVQLHDKHIEVIVRQMMRKVRVDNPGDSDLLPGELVDRHDYELTNNNMLAEGGEPATASPVLLGVTRASLNTQSFLAAASFQETARVLTEAAVNGSIDRLSGLKENVIIGRLIPARLDQTSQGRERLGVEEGEREDGRLTGFTKAPATFEEALAAIGGGDLVGVGAENSDLKPTDETDGSVSNDITDDGGLLAAVSALADVAAGGVESSDSGDDAAARAAEALRASTSTVEENTDSSPQFVDEVNEDESDKSDQ